MNVGFGPEFYRGGGRWPVFHNIMKRFPGKRLGSAQFFSYQLSTAQCLIENTFGILVQRFRIFRTEILERSEKVIAIVIASVCLRNLIISTRGARKLYSRAVNRK